MITGNRKELYQKTVDILYYAYFNNTLRHSNCFACAVGNIIAANKGFSFTPSKPIGIKWADQHEASEWHYVFCTTMGRQIIQTNNYRGKAKEQIDSTGYTLSELAKIEFAFETAEPGASPEDRMFNGLSAVLDTLKEIHQISDNSEEMQRFRAHYLR